MKQSTLRYGAFRQTNSRPGQDFSLLSFLPSLSADSDLFQDLACDFQLQCATPGLIDAQFKPDLFLDPTTNSESRRQSDLARLTDLL